MARKWKLAGEDELVARHCVREIKKECVKTLNTKVLEKSLRKNGEFSYMVAIDGVLVLSRI